MKDKSLEGLRGLAALTVVLAHALFVYFPFLTNRRQPYEGAVSRSWVDSFLNTPPFNLLLIADTAVIIFFVLSGYVLTLKFFENRDTGVIQAAAIRRYPRLILPAAASVFFAWTLLSLGLMANQQAPQLDLAGWPIHYYNQPKTFLDALTAAFVYVPFTGETFFNGPLWSIQVEFLGSMLLFAAFALFGRHSLILTTLFFLFIGKMLSGNGSGLLFYIAILGGALLHPMTSWLRASPIVSAAAVALGLFLSATDHTTSYAWLTKLPLPNLNPVLPNLNANTTMFWQTVGSWVLVCGVIGCRPFANFCGSAIPAYLGRISFAIYLLHLPLIMSVMIHAMAWGKAVGLPFIGSFFFSFAVFSITLLVLAELFTRWVDEPAIRLSRRFEQWLTRSRPAKPLTDHSTVAPEAALASPARQ